MSSSYTLVAMPSSGESLLARDAAGTLWLIRLALDSEVVGDEVIAEALRDGWDLVDQSFDSWSELQAGRNQWVAQHSATEVEDNIPQLSDEDVRQHLRVVLRWQRRGESNRGQRLLTRLLADCPAVYRNAALRREVADLLLTAQRPALARLSAPTSSRSWAAQRLQLPAAA